MDEKATQRLAQIHTEAFERYLVVERALRIAEASGHEAHQLRAKRDRLRERAAGYALVLVQNSRRH